MLETNTVTTRSADMTDTNPPGSYTYNYNYLPPLAMVDRIPPAEAFSARPDWIVQVARSALKILINSIMIGAKQKGENIDFVQQVLKDLKSAAQLIGDDGHD